MLHDDLSFGFKVPFGFAGLSCYSLFHPNTWPLVRPFQWRLTWHRLLWSRLQENFQGPGDSKSIKFLGVFGVDCFSSKFDAFLTKAPETAKTLPLELNDSTLSSSCLKAVSPLSMLHTAWEAVVSRLFHWEKQSRSPHRAFAKHGLYLINWKRWKLPAKLPQKAAKLPQKPSNSRKSRKVVDLCLVAIGCKNEAKVSSQLEVKHPWYVRQKWFA